MSLHYRCTIDPHAGRLDRLAAPLINLARPSHLSPPPSPRHHPATPSHVLHNLTNTDIVVMTVLLPVQSDVMSLHSLPPMCSPTIIGLAAGGARYHPEPWTGAVQSLAALLV